MERTFAFAPASNDEALQPPQEDVRLSHHSFLFQAIFSPILGLLFFTPIHHVLQSDALLNDARRCTAATRRHAVYARLLRALPDEQKFACAAKLARDVLGAVVRAASPRFKTVIQD